MDQPTLSLSDIRASVRESQQELLKMFDEADDQALYQKHDQENWSFAVMLSHLTEARVYMTDHARRALTAPGANVGRSLDEEHRLDAIHAAQENRIPREELRLKLIESHAVMSKFLDSLTLDKLAIPINHARWGAGTLCDFIQRSLAEHDIAHIEQAKSIMQNPSSGQ
jgi:hypothetical protein